MATAQNTRTEQVRTRPNRMRSFDPRRLGRHECAAWVAYYRRQWGRLLWASVGMVRTGFGMSWPRTLHGAWLVLRANQCWAPFPDNDPDGARRHMRRFYELVTRVHGEPFDVDEAARLEVEWWRVHRELQRVRPEDDPSPLVDALARLYAHVYRLAEDDARPAALDRAYAMHLSDRWVAEGCTAESPLLVDEEAALVRSYAALLAAAHRPTGTVPWHG